VSAGMWLQHAILANKTVAVSVTRHFGWIANASEGMGMPRILAELGFQHEAVR
jgi:hypothetical protein